MPRDDAEEDLGWHQRQVAMEEAKARLVAHAGYQAHLEQQAFVTMLDGVFGPNAAVLVKLLDRAATDEELGYELVQNVHDDLIARRFRAELSRLLHNYVASTMTLVEHSRRLVRGCNDTLRDARADRRSALRSHGEVPFMMGLRVFIQHRALPFLGHTVRLSNPAYDDSAPGWESEVELSKASLLEWEKWEAPARRFLVDQDNAIPLRPIVKKHAGLVYQANAWLLRELENDNASALEEANDIVVEIEAATAGLSIDEARLRVERTTADRSRPRPARSSNTS